MKNSKWDLACSVSELESLGLQTPKLNELNDSYEIEKLVENLKQKSLRGLQIHACLHRLSVDQWISEELPEFQSEPFTLNTKNIIYWD